MKKTFVPNVVAAAVLAGLSATGAQAQTVVKLGNVGPLTGPSAHLGKDMDNGARMAVEDLNARRLKIDGKEVKFELLGEDDGGDPKQATAVAQKLADAGIVGIVGHLQSGASIPASRVYHEAGIPQISPASTNPKYTQQGFDSTFRVVANDAHLGGTLGRYAVQELKARTIAIVDDRTAYGQGVADEFEKAAKASGAKVSSREYTTDKSTDFAAILTKIRGAKPDVVFFGGMDSVGGPLLRQMGQLGIEARLMGGDGMCTDKLAELAGGAAGDNRVFCAEAGGITPDFEPAAQKWRDSFQKRFGAPVVLYAPYVYDAVTVMAEAMVKADSTSPKKYLPSLARIQHRGVTGPIEFDAKGDIKGGTLTMYTYKGGKRERLAVVK